MLGRLRAESRQANADEQLVLAGWSSWGAIPQVFDESKGEWAAEREQLRGLLTEKEWEAAELTTLNAHFTSPAIAEAMWQSLQGLGMERGEVLEPGCGTGNFIGLAPESMTMTGVELDPVTAEIAQHLYPGAEVKNESFADTRVYEGLWDAAIGNVPFSEVKLVDEAWNPGRRHAMHNHFIGKSMAGLAPGGVGVMLTSAWTLDARNPAFRAELSKTCDFLGAVRLPNGAHQRTAGTQALTDIVVLRKRLDGEEPNELTRQWVRAQPFEVPGQAVDARQVTLNDYFAEHPEQVLGTFSRGGRFHSLMVESDSSGEELAAEIRDGLDRVVTSAIASDRGYTPADPAVEERRAQRRERAADVELPEGSIVVVDGQIVEVEDGEYAPVKVAKKHQSEVESLIELRGHAVGLVRMQLATPAESDEIVQAREDALAAWQEHVERFGPVNRFTTRWVNRSRVDEETGERMKVREEVRRPSPAAVAMKSDPMWPTVAALERFNEETQSAEPAAILSRRTVFQDRPLLGADTAEEALQLSIEQIGHADLTRVAALLGTDEATARDELGELVYDDPASGKIVSATDYLSGNVRKKLTAAREVAHERPGEGFERNVAALEAVIPDDVPVEDIEAVVGAVWIPDSDHQDFLRDLTGDSHATVISPGPTIWHVKPGVGGRQTVKAQSDWGTERRPAHDLFRQLLSGGPIQVFDEHVDADGKTTKVLNPVETEAAREKAELISERFSEWVWEQPERAARLQREYNERFNALVMRDYKADGQRLALPGLAADFKPHEHQRTAVARIVGEPAVGLFHEVGAGKTAAMVMGMMELKRRGLVNKPCVVVPGHMLEQFSREWQQLYPNARLLAAGSDDLKTTATADGRARFAARAATGEWDGIILTGAAFERIGVAKDTRESYIGRQVASAQQALDAMSKIEGIDQNSRTVKALRKALKNEEEKLKSLLPDRDAGGLNFEDIGIDYIALDEAHLVKNLHTLSAIPGASINGSKRAQDMHMKLDYLREVHGERVVTFATGTPIPNAITEAHVMMRFLRPDLLAENGTEAFDAWANTFGEQVARIERDAGGRLRTKTRLARFKNVPEMLSVWHQFADTKLTSELDLQLPELVVNSDGERRPEMVIIPRSTELGQYMDRLTARLDALTGRAQPGQDNHLAVYGDGRRAALDLRLVGEQQGDPSKVQVITERVAGIWHEVRDRQYPVASHVDADLSEKPGGLQIVFCDLSTPRADRWDFYTELRKRLVEQHGMDRERIAFMHQARNDEEKAALFRRAREGDLDVLVGSSELMGTGANIQLRAAALHHVDCPWRPAELTQREGRILRQGNANEEVQVIRYAVEDSFDSTQWDTIFRKAAATAQIMRSSFDARELDDPGDLALDAQQLMAAASGNPLVMRRVEVDTQVQKLSRRERGFKRGQAALQHRARMATTRLAALKEQLPAVEAAAARAVDTTGDAFSARVGGRTFTKRAEANQAVLDELNRGFDNWSLAAEGGLPLCEVGGQQFSAKLVRDRWEGTHIRVGIGTEPIDALAFKVDLNSLRTIDPEQKPRVMTHAENRVKALPSVVERLRSYQADATKELEETQQGLGKPFKHAEELAAARQELAEIEAEIARQAEPESEETGQAVVEAFARMNSERSSEAAAAFSQACHSAGVDPRETMNRLKTTAASSDTTVTEHATRFGYTSEQNVHSIDVN